MPVIGQLQEKNVDMQKWYDWKTKNPKTFEFGLKIERFYFTVLQKNDGFVLCEVS